MKRHSSVMLLPSRVDETKSSHSSISSNSSGCGSMNEKGTYRSSFVHGDVQKEMVARNEAQKVNYCQFSSIYHYFSLSLYIYIYIYVCVCVCVHISVYLLLTYFSFVFIATRTASNEIESRFHRSTTLSASLNESKLDENSNKTLKCK